MAPTWFNTNFLCSDFIVKNLIGVSQETEEHVLVTCKGVVKLYNVPNQIQIHSWTTKTWHPFTAAAVYEASSNKIIAVVNHHTILRWTRDEDDIDKVKRENFETQIHQLIVSEGTVYVVFINGKIENLETALNTRKEEKTGCVEENELITYAAIEEKEDIAILTVKDEEGNMKVWRFHLKNSAPPVYGNLGVKDDRLTGICLLSYKLFTLWSSGDFHCFNLQSDPFEKLPGRHYSTIESLDASKNTKIMPLSSNHFAIVGADVKDEGGVLLLWDVKFAIMTSIRKLKMFHNPPLAWVSSSGAIVADGASLSCTPYAITDSTLATIFGSRISKESAYPPESCYGWDATVDDKRGEMKTIYVNKSEELVEILKSLGKFSLTESMLVEAVIEILIEKKNLLLLNEVITEFSEIPESCLITVLKHYIQCEDSDFDGLLKYPEIRMEARNQEDTVVKCPIGRGKAYFVNSILRKPHTDILLTKEMHKLSFEDSLCLIQYLYFLILAEEVLLCSVDDQTKDLSLAEVGEWLARLLDAKYHPLIMTSQVDIHRLLLSCFQQMSNIRKVLDEMTIIEPLLRRIVKHNGAAQDALRCKDYNLERLVLFPRELE